MKKDTESLHQLAGSDNERQRLQSLPGFPLLESQLDADLERLVERWSAWRVYVSAADRGSLAGNCVMRR